MGYLRLTDGFEISWGRNPHRGYWQEPIDTLAAWGHRKVRLFLWVYPRALSITTGRSVGVAHYLLGGIGTT
eukprot:12416617-Karenia_brevis.AAC.1